MLSIFLCFILIFSQANKGEIIVALVDDEATLKHFYKDTKNHYL